MNNFLIIGSGDLSKKIFKKLKILGKNCYVIPLREISDRKKHEHIFKSEINKVIYLGYDHFSFIKNIYALLMLIFLLKKFSVNAPLIFFSTQIALKKIYKKSKEKFYFDSLFLDRYILVKKVQVFLLKIMKFDSLILYIPIVENTKNHKELIRHVCNLRKALNFRGNGYFKVSLSTIVDTIIKNTKPSKLLLYDSFTRYDEILCKSSSTFEIKNIKSAYGLDKYNHLIYVIKKIVRSYTSLIMYLFIKGSVKKDAPLNNSLNPEIVRFISLTFKD